jgi:hypothetical protein
MSVIFWSFWPDPSPKRTRRRACSSRLLDRLARISRLDPGRPPRSSRGPGRQSDDVPVGPRRGGAAESRSGEVRSFLLGLISDIGRARENQSLPSRQHERWPSTGSRRDGRAPSWSRPCSIFSILRRWARTVSTRRSTRERGVRADPLTRPASLGFHHAHRGRSRLPRLPPVRPLSKRRAGGERATWITQGREGARP